MFLGFLTQLFSGKSQQTNFAAFPVYPGNDLGLTYSPVISSFRLWAPGAANIHLNIYKKADDPQPEIKVRLLPDQKGSWRVVLPGDLKGKFYTFSVFRDNKWYDEVPDPYAKAVSVNGRKAMVVNLAETNPAGWNTDKSPPFNAPTDAVIYELHVRDASIALNSGIREKGKFLGLTERRTHNGQGLSTGLDHIRELGVTHVHLLPCFDFNSVDETKPGAQYNWGYDPLNYNVPEGSYASNPYDGVTRIREFKKMIQAFHAAGLRVVMDVVYNHTALTEKSNFNQIVPGYYYRQNPDGKFSNATACGNETASERPMVRKFILESMKYWVQEYHVDGFRVDLMGVHDIATMNEISKELHKIKPGILLYGEGWTAGASPLPDSLRALKANAGKLDRIAVFSDDIRDGIKGSVFEHADRGFASGKAGMEASVKFGIVASCPHPQVDYARVNYSKKPWATSPAQTITYCECHDNHVLWDKLTVSAPDATEEERINMHKLSLSIVLTSQGISFLHAGTEFLRSKKGVENSFESPDSINAIDWSLKSRHKDVTDYVRTLIRMRRDHPAFRMKTAKSIATDLHFEEAPGGVIIYTLNGAASGDRWKKIWVGFNGTATVKRVSTGPNNWFTFIRDNGAVRPRITRGEIEMAPYSCTVLYIN